MALLQVFMGSLSLESIYKDKDPYSKPKCWLRNQLLLKDKLSLKKKYISKFKTANLQIEIQKYFESAEI